MNGIRLTCYYVALIVSLSATICGAKDFAPIAGIEPVDIRVQGSSTTAHLFEQWIEGFRRYYPTVLFKVDHSTSTEAEQALRDGRVDIAMMAQKMERKEFENFHSVHAYYPMRLILALDSIVVVTNKRNRILQLNKTALTSVFSDDHRCGRSKPIITWGDLGVQGPLKDKQPILMIASPGRASHDFFRKKALCGGSFKEGAQGFETDREIVARVGGTHGAVGFISMSMMKKSLNVIALPSRYGDELVIPAEHESTATNYPLTRYLQVYVNVPKGMTEKHPIKEFFRYAFSSVGVEALHEKGFVPLSEKFVEKNIKALGL